jgi:hypothetical protein
MRKILIGVIVFVAILVVAIFIGPRPSYELVSSELPSLAYPLTELDSLIATWEKSTPGLKPDNQAQVIWFDSVRKTTYSLVYLHGFSASHREGFPIHTHIAKKYGMNLYLSRLYGHGVETDSNFLDLTPRKLLKSAKQAIGIGGIIGDSVIVMSCSTGGTYSIYLSAFNGDKIHSQILYSPNVRIFDPSAELLTGPWGRQLAYGILGEERGIQSGRGSELEKYWTYNYSTEGVIALQALIDQTMKPEVWKKVSIPTMAGYYYKSDSAMDSVISVQAIRQFLQASKIPSDKLHDVPFPNVGDHVIASDLKSADIESVTRETEYFIENILGIRPVQY